MVQGEAGSDTQIKHKGRYSAPPGPISTRLQVQLLMKPYKLVMLSFFILTWAVGTTFLFCTVGTQSDREDELGDLQA